VRLAGDVVVAIVVVVVVVVVVIIVVGVSATGKVCTTAGSATLLPLPNMSSP
jgi:hypothetical protein